MISYARKFENYYIILMNNDTLKMCKMLTFIIIINKIYKLQCRYCITQ